MMVDSDFDADLCRYPARPFLKEQSIWAICVYRYGRRVLIRNPGFRRTIQLKLYWLSFRIIEMATGISISLDARIGPGLRIHHFGNIFIHSEAVVGRNCTLRQGVTIGNLADGAAPVVGDDVDFGAYAQVLGNVRIGNGVKVGVMTVVLSDVPAGATAFGVPARILPYGG